MNKERTILYLFSINAIIYIASGFYTPFLSAYYAQKGIDAEKIGILLMIGPCVVLLTQRFWAKISDRTGKRKEVLLVTIVGSGFSMLLYYLGNSFLCMFFATVVVTSFTTAVIPLSDAILIARSLKEGYSYSIIRLGGTLGYAVMTICAGMYLKTRPQMQFVFAFFAYMILFCFCICENGIVCEMDKVNAIVDKMKNRKIDALFFPFCDFGEEQVVAAIASKFTVPILIWGPRDERPNTDEARGRDTQCGMFAATKVLQR